MIVTLSNIFFLNLKIKLLYFKNYIKKILLPTNTPTSQNLKKNNKIKIKIEGAVGGGSDKGSRGNWAHKWACVIVGKVRKQIWAKNIPHVRRREYCALKGKLF